MTMNLVLSAFTSSPVSLIATTKSLYFFYGMYASAQYVNNISVNQKQKCTI